MMLIGQRPTFRGLLRSRQDPTHPIHNASDAFRLISHAQSIVPYCTSLGGTRVDKEEHPGMRKRRCVSDPLELPR